jgi:hypothetical protein
MISEHTIRNAYELSQIFVHRGFLSTLRVLQVLQHHDCMEDDAARELVFGAMQAAFEGGFYQGIDDYIDYLRKKEREAKQSGCPAAHGCTRSSDRLVNLFFYDPRAIHVS